MQALGCKAEQTGRSDKGMAISPAIVIRLSKLLRPYLHNTIKKESSVLTLGYLLGNMDQRRINTRGSLEIGVAERMHAAIPSKSFNKKPVCQDNSDKLAAVV